MPFLNKLVPIAQTKITNASPCKVFRAHRMRISLDWKWIVWVHVFQCPAPSQAEFPLSLYGLCVAFETQRQCEQVACSKVGSWPALVDHPSPYHSSLFDYWNSFFCVDVRMRGINLGPKIYVRQQNNFKSEKTYTALMSVSLCQRKRSG